MNKCLMAILFVLSSLSLSAQAKFVNEFLNIGVGARAHGMFGSVVATSNDVHSAYWNPAGLARMETEMQASGMHASWFGGVANYDYLGIAKELGSTTCLLYTSPSPRDQRGSRMPSSA